MLLIQYSPLAHRRQRFCCRHFGPLSQIVGSVNLKEVAGRVKPVPKGASSSAGDQIEALRKEFEESLDEEERNIAMDVWSKN
ncbi:hypothetical protein T06_1925 [Trichinella sp. T6]|nr:hypothetical protein T06_1925 [Trichinella sp. T6]